MPYEEGTEDYDRVLRKLNGTFTGADGIYSTFFEAPGIFSVKASLNLAEGGQRRGTGTVRTIEGETKTVTVILTNDVYY